MKNEIKLSKEQLAIMSGIQETKRNWYISATEEIYTAYSGIRLTDAQLAKLLVKTYGGTIPSHTAKIRQTQCNAKWQEYVDATLIGGIWVKDKKDLLNFQLF